MAQVVVADRQPFQLRQSADLPWKFAQLIGVQHENSQVDEVADFRRQTTQTVIYARLPLRAQVKHLSPESVTENVETNCCDRTKYI